MKNVCFLIGDLNSSGGTERVTTLIANELSKREEYKISILSLTDGLEPFFSLNPDISIYSLYEKKISFKTKLFGVIWKIRQFVKSRNIDTLIVVESISCIFTVPALYGLVVNHICWEHFHFKNNNGIYFRDFARKLAAKYCNYVVTLTNKDIGFWREGIKNLKANLICIPNPSPFKDITHSPSLESKSVLTIGRLTEVKGYDLLIQAWKKTCEKNKEWKLYIVGDGPEEENLKKLTKDLNLKNRVVFIGKTNDVISFYKKSSFFCLSSRNEGLPMVLLEAQAYGLPIVAFDCDTGPSEIVVNKKNGFLVSNGNIESLAYHLNEIINFEDEKYEKMVFESFLSTQNFKIENILDKWCSIL